MQKRTGAVAITLDPNSSAIPDIDTYSRHGGVTPADRELRLIADAQQNPARFAPLYDTYASMVWRFAMSRLGDPERARDATSTTFVKAIQSLPTFKPKKQGEGTSFPGWLMMIARNTIIDDQRKHRPSADIHAPELQGKLAAKGTPESHAMANDERARVRMAISTLHPRQQQIVEMRIAGYSGQEIAEAIGMSINGVRTAQSRAYARLRDLLIDDIDQKENNR